MEALLLMGVSLLLVMKNSFRKMFYTQFLIRWLFIGIPVIATCIVIQSDPVYLHFTKLLLHPVISVVILWLEKRKWSLLKKQ